MDPSSIKQGPNQNSPTLATVVVPPTQRSSHKSTCASITMRQHMRVIPRSSKSRPHSVFPDADVFSPPPSVVVLDLDDDRRRSGLLGAPRVASSRLEAKAFHLSASTLPQSKHRTGMIMIPGSCYCSSVSILLDMRIIPLHTCGTPDADIQPQSVPALHRHHYSATASAEHPNQLNRFPTNLTVACM